VTDENRQVHGITRGGDTVPLGVREHPSAPRNDGGLSAGDQRIIQTVARKYTKEDGLGGETTDWASVARELRDTHGRPDLARLVEPPEGARGGVDVMSDEYREAQR